jgi:hypothetical protein
VARFSFETDPKKGQTGVRVTTGAPKKLTYARRVRIVDDEDNPRFPAIKALFD